MGDFERRIMNKVILMGRLTRDPEVKYTQGENTMAIARYTLAVDRRFKRDGEAAADFISCVAFGRQAEFAEKSLIDLVDVENVSTNKGSRTYKKRSQQTGFTKVGEGGKIPGGTTPQFERMDYEIEKYAGYFPTTNELLADSDANITGVLVSWIGDESRVTRNKLILNVINQKEKTDLAGIDDIKKALTLAAQKGYSADRNIEIMSCNYQGERFLLDEAENQMYDVRRTFRKEKSMTIVLTCERRENGV